MMIKQRFHKAVEFLSKAFPWEQQRAERDMRPFYWVVILVLIFLYGLALNNNAGLRQPGPWLLFTGLMVLHGLLHWYYPVFTYHPPGRIIYLVGQGLLATLIAVIAREITFPMDLSAILIGEAVGVMTRKRDIALMILFQIGLAVLGSFLISGLIIPGWSLAILPVTGFVIFYVMMVKRQINAREQAQKLLRELEEAHRQLADYTVRVEELTRAAERERIARDLHDTLAQGVAGLVLQLEAVKNHLENARVERAADVVDQALQRARGTLTEARAAIDDLRVARSAPPSLSSAIRGQVSQFTLACGIPCELDIAATIEGRSDVPTPIIENARRITSEALFNVIRHAQAAHVWVSMKQVNTDIVIEVRDDGIGFASDAVEKEGNYGMKGMRERAQAMGGRLEIEGVPGAGTRIRAILPLGATPGAPSRPTESGQAWTA